jgi:putative FmdB family regulatory protein
MPTYEYRCENGHSFEVLQRMADEPLTTCEVCSAPVQRVLHAPAVHFKGSGFYNTDYGTKKRARELKEAGEGKSNSDGASSEKKDSGSESSSDKKRESGSTSSASDSKGDSSSSSKSDAKPAPAAKKD